MQAAPSRRLVQRRRARADSPRRPGRVLDRVQVGLAGRVHKAGQVVKAGQAARDLTQCRRWMTMAAR